MIFKMKGTWTRMGFLFTLLWVLSPAGRQFGPRHQVRIDATKALRLHDNIADRRLSWLNEQIWRNRDNAINGGQSRTVVQPSANIRAGKELTDAEEIAKMIRQLKAGGRLANQKTENMKNGPVVSARFAGVEKRGRARGETKIQGQRVPKTESTENGPVFTTRFSRDPPHRKESIDPRRTSAGDVGRIPFRGQPGSDNGGAKMVLGAFTKPGKFAERLYTRPVSRNTSRGYHQLRPHPSPRARPKSIFLRNLERRRDPVKAAHSAVKFSPGEISPGDAAIVPFSDSAIDGAGKYVIDISVNKAANSTHSVRTATSNFHSALERPRLVAIKDNEVRRNKTERATKVVPLPRARRDATNSNYTVGDVSNSDSGNPANSISSMVATTENLDNTGPAALSSQPAVGTTRTTERAGSESGGTTSSVPAQVTLSSASYSPPPASESSLDSLAVPTKGTEDSGPENTSSDAVSSSTTTVPANPTTITTTHATVTASSSSSTLLTSSTSGVTTPTAASTSSTTPALPPPPTTTTKTTAIQSSPASSSSIQAATTTTTQKSSSPSLASSLALAGSAQTTTELTQVSMTETTDQALSNSAKTNSADTTQASDLPVGESVNSNASSGDALILAWSVDSVSVTEESTQQISTADAASLTNSEAVSTRTTVSVAGINTPTHMVVRGSDATQAPTTPSNLSTSPDPSTPSSSAVETSSQPTEPPIQSPEIITADQSATLSDVVTTTAPFMTVTSTSDLPTTSSEDKNREDPLPEGDSHPEPTEMTDEYSAEGAVAEPGPDWPVAKMVWGEAWELHLYFFGCLFGLLGVYTLVSVLRLWSIHRLLSRRYFISLNLLMMLLCSTRTIYLLLDGYNSNRTFHPSLDYFLYSISFPCLSSAFGIQLYALLQATKMQFLPPTIQKMSMLIVVTVFHFAISIATDVVVGMYAGMRIMLFVCQLFFILWGLFLFFGYAYIFRRLYLHAVKRQKNVIQKTGSYSMTGGITKPKSKFTLSVAVKVTFSTAILGLVSVGLEVYGIVSVYKIFSDDRPQTWPFYIYHTTLRLIEFVMCATMSYVASQPFRYRRRRKCCCCPVLCAPCAEICCCGADVNRSNSLAGWSDIDQHQLRTSFDRGKVQNANYLHDGVSNGQHDYHSNGGGDLTVAAKTRIYFKDKADVMPILMSQPTSLSDSRPTSANSDIVDENTMSTRGSRGSVTGSIDGMVAYNNLYRALHSPTGDTRFFPSGQRSCGLSTSTPVRSRDGMVNTAYSSAVDDPQSPGFASSKSRNGSIASSDFFHAPSVSLADSMASELDKAFRSMHEEQQREADTRTPSNAHTASTPSLPSLDDKLETQGRKKKDGVGGSCCRGEPPVPKSHSTFPGSSIQRFLQQQQQNSDLTAGMVLRRARSAIGRCSFQEVELLQGGLGVGEGRCSSPSLGASNPWHTKLFRSRSDNTGGIRTKDLDNARYMLLPDFERSELLTHSLKASAPSKDTSGSVVAASESGYGKEQSFNNSAGRDTTSSHALIPPIQPKSTPILAAGLAGAYRGHSGVNASALSASSGSRDRSGTGRLKYRDDDSDDNIEV